MTKKRKKNKKQGGSEEPLLEGVALVSQSSDEREVVYNQQLQLQQSCPGLLVCNATAPSPSSASLAAIFVCHFDNLNGNVVSWSSPPNINSRMAEPLRGLEFKAIASGMHNLVEDYVMFTHGQHYGIAAFHRAGAPGRDVHMQAIGLLAPDLEGLREHLPFLESESRDHTGDDAQYSRLRMHLDAHGGLSTGQLVMGPREIPLEPLEMPASAQVSPITGAITRLVHHFRQNLFVLWKAMHLGKRIMLYSPAPMGPVCERILAACAIMQHSFPRPQMTQAECIGPYPIFNISASGCEDLANERDRYCAYIGCTADKVLQYRPELCDIWVNNQDIIVHNDNMALKQTETDARHFEEIMGILGSVGPGDPAGIESSEASLQLFFVEMNNQLHRTLEDAYHHQAVLTNSTGSLGSMTTGCAQSRYTVAGTEDAHFMQALSDVYGLQIHVKIALYANISAKLHVE